MPLQIVALSGPLAGRTFALGSGPLSFGRTPENTIVISSPLASRRHAELRFEGGGYVLYDLNSSNGTLLNGQRVQVQRMRPGDVITIGDESFRFDAPIAAVDKTLLATPQPAPTQLSGGAGFPPLAQAGPAPLPPPPVAGPNFSVPAGAASAPPRKRSRWPLCLALSLLFLCVAGAGLGGGVYWYTRGGGGGPTGGGGTSGGGILGTNPTRVPNSAGTNNNAPPPTREPAQGSEAAWTVMVYLDGDNNLESDALTDFAEMARVGSDDQINIVVQLDRVASSESWDDTSAGDWDGTKRFLVEPGMRPTEENALEDLGELNMGDPDVLADFIAWGVESYPAQRYAVILWDHGASWLGIASDDTSGDVLNLPELSAALETARQRSGYGTLDLIGFDACLMAQLDVFVAVQPYAQVVVASAELEPNTGWAWDAWLQELANDPQQDVHAIASVIVETYMDSFSLGMADEVTLSAFDLEKLDPLTSEVNQLAQAMIADMRGSYPAIGQARSFVDVYAPSYSEEFNAIDLGHFVELLPEHGAKGEVADAAARVNAALQDARIANVAGSYHRGASGVSIYFPQLAELYVDDYERGSPLPRATKWADFLKTYHGTGDVAVTQPTISGLDLDSPVVSMDRLSTLSGKLSGSDIAYVFAFIGIPNASRDSVDLIYVDFIYPPGATQNDTEPVWPDGEFDLSLTWDATNWYLSNGRDQIEALVGPIKYGSRYYGVEGVYTSKATGEKIDAGLIFDVQGTQGTLVRIWGFPKGKDKQEAQPYELTPAPGDTFTAYTRSYTDTGDNLEADRVAGQTITFGDTPLSASFGPTINGDYVMGFLVRDIAGNFSYDYVDVTVENP
ncbi:FHA domain containing protein [Oscillochloris trichoides DG-6]|uniref:FHA domain containing protein n=1 Tax=Oscillochloris trichoides DG-6 TaxID=765420 RepID=E1IC36_9CHLR|nr:clostripain-related cysteine peptidase [Oscillochloris trichoides]EFO81226.1 FHA domain containing protein [Oscillochloris trichoides DG-6]